VNITEHMNLMHEIGLIIEPNQRTTKVIIEREEQPRVGLRERSGERGGAGGGRVDGSRCWEGRVRFGDRSGGAG